MPKPKSKPRAAAGRSSTAAPKRPRAKPATKDPRKKVAELVTAPAGQAESPLTLVATDSYQRHRARMAERSREASRAGREIPPLKTSQINWERRLACRDDLQRFGRTYMASQFGLPCSRAHERCIDKMQRVSMFGGRFAVAMPRADGKTSWCRANLLWDACYAWRLYEVYLGSSLEAAFGMLASIKTQALKNPLLRQDFPELFWPIHQLANDSGHGARGQLYRGKPTWLKWQPRELMYPSLVLSEEDAKPYLDHAPETLTAVDGGWMAKSGGAILSVVGIGGAIRGRTITHPITLEARRPDKVVADDIQKDVGAASKTTCDRLVKSMDGAVAGLCGPDELIAVVFPCTVIVEGDVADTFLDGGKKPDYQGERCPMVLRWPAGINDYEISADTEAARKWNEYGDFRRDSLLMHGDIRDATKFYARHRRVMDKGFECSWPERYAGDAAKVGGNVELSAQQRAMELRFKSPDTFPAEYQQRPRPVFSSAPIVKPAELAQRVFGIKRGEAPTDTHCIAHVIDVQNEIVFWFALAVNQGFTGAVIDYGTWPPVPSRYFTKQQTEAWGLLTREFFAAYPDQQAKATKNESGRVRAPFEAKIYHAVSSTIDLLLARSYPRAGVQGQTLAAVKTGVDCRWGKASDVIKRAIRDRRRPDILPCFGQGVSPAHKQFEEYQRTAGWGFEDAMHPGLQECKWIWRPGPDGRYYLAIDTNRQKTFLMSRLSCPPGAPGAIGLFDAPPEQHEMFSDHVAASEYPEPVTARGRSKDMWNERDGRPDNDWLDCFVYALALCSFAGARLAATGATQTVPRRGRGRLSQRWKEKHGR